MKQCGIVLLVALFVSYPLSLLAQESLTITTYYPSPYGSYDELRTANNTYLATDAGFVGIGNTAPTEKLDVTGNIRSSGTVTANTFIGATEARMPGIIRQIRHVTGTTNVETSSSTYSNLDQMVITLNTLRNSVLLVLWNVGISNFDEAAVGNTAHIRVTLDGNPIGTYQGGAYTWQDADNDGHGEIRMITVDSMGGNNMAQVAAAGNHTVSLQWHAAREETIYSYPNHPDGYGRSMTVMEIIQPGF